MLRQTLISIVVLVAAGFGWLFLVPGAHTTLSRIGIDLPFGATADAAPEGAARPGPRAGGRGNGGFGARMPSVVVAPATVATINDRLTAIGEGVAEHSVTVVPQSDGRLDEVLVRPGQMVKAGEVLARLDSRSEQIDLDKAKLAAKDAADTLARTEALARTSAATTVQVTSAQLASDNAGLAVETAQLALDRRSITTPIDGRVGLFQVTAGNYVTPQTVVTTIEDTSSLSISFWVPERYAPSLKVGMPVTATAEAALPGKPIAGKVEAIDNKVDPESRTIEVRASIPNADGALTAGMSFSVRLDFPGDKFPAVDPLAVQWSADGAYVWKLKGSKVAKTTVAIIQRNNDGVLVEGLVAPGDLVVTQGLDQLAEGAEVRVLGGEPGHEDAAASGSGGFGRPAPTDRS